MSGFAGGGAGGGPGPGGCASLVYQGLVEIADQGEVDFRVAIGGSGCPLVISPPQLRIYLGIGGGSDGSATFLNHMGGGPTLMGTRALDWQSWRAAAPNNSTARGNNSVAVGINNDITGVAAGAAGAYSTAIGINNVIAGPSCVAVGRGNNMPVPSIQGVAVGFGNLVAPYGIGIGSSQVISNNGVAIGRGALPGFGGAAPGGVAVGHIAQARGVDDVAVGHSAYTRIGHSVAVGAYALARSNYSHSWGFRSISRPERATNITAPIFTRRDSGEGIANADMYFSGANVLIMTHEIQASAVGDYVLTIGGAFSSMRIWLEEVGLIVSNLAVPMAAQPTVRFGNLGTSAKYLAPTLCTLLTAFGARERFNLLLVDEPEVSLSFGITAGGTATNFVRAYFRGHIIEDEGP